jgi:phosphohistidine swiveling domain-containing protein
LPAISHLLTQVVALVSDFGGVTSHAATLAREYNVPAVVGCKVATQLPNGTPLLVDADLGRVLVI